MVSDSHKQQGFSLVELMVVIVIIMILMAAAYSGFTNVMKNTKQESEKVASHIEQIALQVLRLDIEHMGYGIASDETSPIVEWDANSKRLTIRSTINNTNRDTRDYLILKCKAGSLKLVEAGCNLESGWYALLNARTKSYVGDVKLSSRGNIISGNSTCSGTDVYVAFPIRDKVESGEANGCDVGKCERIQYYLSDSPLISRCNPHTHSLLRKVGNGTGEPVINCIADWDVKFDSLTFPADNKKIREHLRLVRVYIVAQEGKKDLNYKYIGNRTITVDDVTLSLPNDYEHYRWRVIRLFVKPMNLYGRKSESK